MGKLTELRTTRAQQPERPWFYGVEATAELLGVSPTTLYREIRGGQFPAVRIRGRYVVPTAVLQRMADDAMAYGLVNATDYVAVVRGGAA